MIFSNSDNVSMKEETSTKITKESKMNVEEESQSYTKKAPPKQKRQSKRKKQDMTNPMASLNDWIN